MPNTAQLCDINFLTYYGILIFSQICPGCLPAVHTQFPHGFPDFPVFLCLSIYTYVSNLNTLSKCDQQRPGGKASFQRLQYTQRRSMPFKDEVHRKIRLHLAVILHWTYIFYVCTIHVCTLCIYLFLNTELVFSAAAQELLIS